MGPLAYQKAFDSLTPGGRLYVEQAGDGGYRFLHALALSITKRPEYHEFFKDFSIGDFYYTPSASQLAQLLADVGYTEIDIQTERIVGNPDVYQAFSVASLHPYFDRLPNSLREQFRTDFLNSCKLREPDRSSVRLVVSAIRPEG